MACSAVTKGFHGTFHIALRLKNSHHRQVAKHVVATQSLTILVTGHNVFVSCIELIPLPQKIGKPELIGAAHARIQSFFPPASIDTPVIEFLCLSEAVPEPS